MGFAKAVAGTRHGCSERIAAMASLPLDSNCERDYHRWLNVARGLGIEPYYIKLKLLTRKTVKPTLEYIPVLPVHELMHAIYERGPSQWRLSMEGDHAPGRAEAYWQRFEHMAWSRAHPGVQNLKQTGRLNCTIPLFFHQDGVEIFRDVEANVWSWASALTLGNDVETKLPLCIAWEEDMPDKKLRLGVNRVVCQYINYCVACMEDGRWPERGFYDEPLTAGKRGRMKGQPLCGDRWRALFAGWKGDGKARKVEN